MKQIFDAVINRGGYKLKDLIERIEQYTADGRLTYEERDALIAKARERARAADEIDITTMLLDHEMRLQAIETGTGGGTGSGVKLVEYTVGIPTVAGQRWLWKGEEYEVIHATPENPCVWSPDGYPYYWRKVE